MATEASQRHRVTPSQARPIDIRPGQARPSEARRGRAASALPEFCQEKFVGELGLYSCYAHILNSSLQLRPSVLLLQPDLWKSQLLYLTKSHGVSNKQILLYQIPLPLFESRDLTSLIIQYVGPRFIGHPPPPPPPVVAIRSITGCMAALV
ncbi:uncharacterized protein LOC119579381 [Penaeus monodon]|uniref:uncharacterized protein LOC119579381 n=1 Tax=Penaeus monodon TaxID=6687 RepID=UPI0018A7E119|nr:uncharacterized protein LOC119579381 [Penaeus monodon]